MAASLTVELMAVVVAVAVVAELTDELVIEVEPFGSYCCIAAVVLNIAHHRYSEDKQHHHLYLLRPEDAIVAVL